MKRGLALLLVIAISAAFATCAPKNSGTHATLAADTTGLYSFTAEVLEVHNNYLLVEPEENSRERSSADKIQISLKDREPWPIPQVGDTVTVVYNGEIQEIYPAQITKVYRVEIIEN